LYVRHIPEHVVEGKRLGRHVRHDPRSLNYRYPAAAAGALASVRHKRQIPVLDQGNLGSCTGNAALGAVGTGALYDALPASPRPSTTDAVADESMAVGLYSAATKLDSYAGGYPPTDTGSDGLSVAKACQQAGLISGYQHCTSLNSALAALSKQPVITGVSWYDSFDQPDSKGLVTITRGAQVRGGHEFVVDELLVAEQLVGFTNSWNESWGVKGRAYMPWGDFDRLLHESGDVTVFVPASQPAPTPTPTPDPNADLAGCFGSIITAAQRGLDILKGK
jgi:hypothetical protein